jgi:serine/threonine protein kinase
MEKTNLRTRTRFSVIRALDVGGNYNKGINLSRNEETGEQVIEKMLPPRDIVHGSADKEIRAYIALDSHPNIVHMVEFEFIRGTEEQSSGSIWFEYCDKGTLFGLLEEYQDQEIPIPEAFLWHVFKSLASALQRSHSVENGSGRKGIIHSDIWLANVFLSSSESDSVYPRVVLGDFGCAVDSIVDESGEEELKVSDYGQRPPAGHLTNFFFSAPEQQDRFWRIGLKTDIYQLGATMRCLVCQIRRPQFTPNGAISKLYSEELKNLITWCIQFHPQRRPNAEQLLAEIELSLARLGTRLEAEPLL